MCVCIIHNDRVCACTHMRKRNISFIEIGHVEVANPFLKSSSLPGYWAHALNAFRTTRLGAGATVNKWPPVLQSSNHRLVVHRSWGMRVKF